MTDQRMALLARLERAAGSSEPDVVREALGWAIEELMEAEVTDRLGAGPHERTPERLGQRNGRAVEHPPRSAHGQVPSVTFTVRTPESAPGGEAVARPEVSESRTYVTPDR